MILAVAMNETDQLGKVFRMMILDDFQKLYPYRLYVLKSGNSFERELNEFHKLQTKEARLAFKYKLLDLSFAEAMLEGKELDDEQKINMARSILKELSSVFTGISVAPACEANTEYSGKKGTKVTTSSPGLQSAHSVIHSAAAAPQVI